MTGSDVHLLFKIAQLHAAQRVILNTCKCLQLKNILPEKKDSKILHIELLKAVFWNLFMIVLANNYHAHHHNTKAGTYLYLNSWGSLVVE